MFVLTYVFFGERASHFHLTLLKFQECTLNSTFEYIFSVKLNILLLILLLFTLEVFAPKKSRLKSVLCDFLMPSLSLYKLKFSKLLTQ